MTYQFPEKAKQDLDPKEVRIGLEMTFDLPLEMTEQLELWGITEFDHCEFEQDRCRIKMSAHTTLYQKGA
jgi:hypothetical protein